MAKLEIGTILRNLIKRQKSEGRNVDAAYSEKYGPGMVVQQTPESWGESLQKQQAAAEKSEEKGTGN